MKKRKARLTSALMIAAMSVSAAGAAAPAYAAVSTGTTSGRTVSSTLGYIHGSTDTDKEAVTGANEKTIYSDYGKVLVKYDAETATFSLTPEADTGYLFVGYDIYDSTGQRYNENYIRNLMLSSFNGKDITVKAFFEVKQYADAEKRPGYIHFLKNYVLDEVPDSHGLMSIIKYKQADDIVSLYPGVKPTATNPSVKYGVKTYNAETGEQISLEDAEKNTAGIKISVKAYAYIPVKENFDSFMKSVVRDPASYGVVSAQASGNNAYKVRFEHGWLTITWNGEAEADPDTVTGSSDRYFTLEAEPDEGYEQTGTLALLGTKGADLIITEEPFYAGASNIFNKIQFTKKTETTNQNDSSDTSANANTGTATGTTGTETKSDTSSNKASGTSEKTETADSKTASKISKISIKKAKISGLKNVKYTGKKVYPKVTVTVGGKKATVKLSTSGNATSIGSGKKLKITGTGNYTGTLTVKYNIIPADIKISVKVSGKKIKTSVKGLKGGAKSQIQYRTVTVTKGKKKYSKWKTLTSRTAFKYGQKAEVRARAAKGKLYGSWTAVKSVTIPKF